MKLNLLTLSWLAYSCTVSAHKSLETEKTSLHCFEFFQSLNKQSLELALHRAVEDEDGETSLHSAMGEDDGEISQPVTITKGSNFLPDLDYDDLDNLFCLSIYIDIGLCFPEELGFPVPHMVFQNESLVYKQLMNLSNNHIFFDQIDETLTYCVLVEERPGVEFLITPHYDGDLEGEWIVNRWDKIGTALLGLLLTFLYVMQTKGSKMDNLSKCMFSFFISSHFLIPALELVLIIFAGWDLPILASITQLILLLMTVVTNLAEETFMALLLKGYTVLPEAQYPLKSKYYLPVIFIAPSLRTLATFVPLGTFLKIILFLYQVFQFRKTNKLLKSLSLRSPRRSQAFKVWMFYFPLIIVVGGAVGGVTVLIFNPAMGRNSPTFWRPREEMIGNFLFALAVESVDLAIVLRFRSPDVVNDVDFTKLD